MVKKSILCLPFVTCGTQVGKYASKEKGTAAYSDDGCHKLNQEVGELQQGWEEMVQKVDEKSFDVRTVVILRAHGQ